MFVTDERFFCEELDQSIPELAKVTEEYRKNGLASAEKKLSEYIKTIIHPDKYFRIPYYERENSWALNTDDDFAAAEKIIRGELRSCGVSTAFPDGNIDWESNPTYNEYKEWTWQLSRHHEFRCLGWCYRQTGDEKYAECFARYLMSWCEQALCPENASSGATKCWRTIEAGIRMTKNWHYAFHAFINSPAMTDHVITTYLKSIWEHGYRLFNFSSSGNWLIMEMAGLAHIAMLYPIFKDTAKWAEYAFSRLATEIDIQVYPDGFQYELSTNYHGVVIQNYYWIMNTAQAIEYPVPSELSKKLERMFDFYTYIVLPNGRMPDLNDGNSGPIDHWMKIGLSYFPEREDFRYFATHGKEGHAPNFLSHAMPYSGLAIMRTDWSENAIWCFMDAGPFGKGHQHEDKLNVLMFAYGKNVLKDTGNYSYDTSEMRKFVLDTRAHNCAMIDNLSQNRRKTYKWSPEMISELSDMKWSFTSEADTVEGIYNEGYGSELLQATHNRKLIFFKEGINGSLPFALVIDRFASDDGAEHDYQVSYQMDIRPYEIKDGIFTADHGDGVTMSIIGSVEPEVIIAQKEPLFMGWRPKGGANSVDFEHHHAPCLRYTSRGKEARTVTALYPSNNGEIAIKKVEASADPQSTVIVLTFADGSITMLDESEYTTDPQNNIVQ